MGIFLLFNTIHDKIIRQESSREINLYVHRITAEDATSPCNTEEIKIQILHKRPASSLFFYKRYQLFHFKS